MYNNIALYVSHRLHVCIDYFYTEFGNLASPYLSRGKRFESL